MLISAYEIPECLSASLSHSGTMDEFNCEASMAQIFAPFDTKASVAGNIDSLIAFLQVHRGHPISVEQIECAVAGIKTQAVPMQPTRLPPEQRGEMAFDLRCKIVAYGEKMNAKNVYDVIKIIRKSFPGIYDNVYEIELDVNTLDNTTLWTLWDYFEDNAAAREAAKAKRKRG